MKFTFVTLFTNLIKPYFEDSILKIAIQKKLIEVDFYNPRDFTKDKHKKVDDTLIGGGAGMLMSPQPLDDTISHIKEQDLSAYIIFLTPSAKLFNQKDAKRLSKKKHIVFVSGRYEGIDERVIEMHANEVFSIGDYILTGGELPSLVMCDAISRNIPGVLGNELSLEVESYENHLLEAPSFTKPNIFKKRWVIKEFLKGNHGKIATLKYDLSLLKTKYHRTDLYKKLKTEGKCHEK